MNSKPYKIIFALLSVSIVFILVLQGFWIYNFYYQKVDEFDRTVYQSLSHLSSKLQERENIQIIKHSIQKTDEKPKKKIDRLVKVIVSSSGNANVIETDGGPENKHMRTIINNNGKIFISDSIVQIKTGQTSINVNKQATNGKKDELEKLLDKMLLEIKSVDASYITNTHPDTLKNLITKDLAAKGISIPFEFALKKSTENVQKILLRSKGFSENNAFYKSDLSADKVFSTYIFLLVQFPGKNSFILKGMQTTLILSALFSLLILSAFYYSIRLILKQKKINEIKNDFINNMTHELKTPIATISLAIDSINNPLVKTDDEKFKNYTRILKEENNKLNSHVERVLQMAMLDKGELQLNKQTVNVVTLTKNAIETFRLQIQEKNAKINFESALPEIKLAADKFHLQNAICNLLDNALKYSNTNCEINISIEKTQNTVLIKIKDNGIGIDPSLHEKVFDKFYRVQGGNLHDTKGFGLGLSYVRSIMEAHNGTITLQSEKNKGSEFIITLTYAD